MLGLYIVGMFALGIGFIVGAIRCITAFVKKKPNRIQELLFVLLIFVVLIADFNELKKVSSAGTTNGNKAQETVAVDTETGYRKIYEAFAKTKS